MGLIRAGVPQFYNYGTYNLNPGLNVAMLVRNEDTNTLIATIPMIHRQLGGYTASFVPQADTNYMISAMVFTDNTYTTPDSANFSPAHYNDYAEAKPSSGGGSQTSCGDFVLKGNISNVQLLLGSINSQMLVGTLETTPVLK